MQDWGKSTVAGFLALADGRTLEAAAHWLYAAQRADFAAAREPLSAAVHNNAGVALLLASNTSDAAERFARATEHWSRTHALIEAADLPITSSSVFHIRLAIEHHETFANVRRRRYLDLCAAAQAATQFNANLASGRTARADRGIVQLWSAAFGPACPEVRILRQAEGDGAQLSTVALAAYRDKATGLAQGTMQSYIDTEHFWADVECAVRTTALLHPGLLPSQSEPVQTEGRGRGPDKDG